MTFGETLRGVTIANVLQGLLMISLFMNWWSGHESTNSVTAVIIQQHGDRLASLEQDRKEQGQKISDIQTKINVLIAVAEEERKRQK